VIVAARIAAAKVAAAAKAREQARIAAAAKAKRGKLLAKGRGGKDKPAAAKVAAKPADKPADKSKQPAKIAERAPTDKGKGGKTRLAETSAAKR
jgi:hypothetical protein